MSNKSYSSKPNQPRKNKMTDKEIQNVVGDIIGFVWLAIISSIFVFALLWSAAEEERLGIDGISSERLLIQDDK
jgi:hypothetical protein